MPEAPRSREESQARKRLIFFCQGIASGFFKKNLSTYLFLAVLGLYSCIRAFSSCGEQRPLFIVVWGLQ